MTTQELLRKVATMQQQLAEISAALLEPEGLKLPRVRLTEADIYNIADEVAKRYSQSAPATLETAMPGISETLESRWEEIEDTGPVKAWQFSLNAGETSVAAQAMGRQAELAAKLVNKFDTL